jgi:soluble lytic murein transglycosylase-like protein
LKNELKSFTEYEITPNFLIFAIIIVVMSIMVVSYKTNITSNNVEDIRHEIIELKNVVENIEEKEIMRDIGTIIMYIDFLADKKLDRKYLKKISTAFYTASKHYKIDPKILVSIAWHESRFMPNRTSVAGAIGIMQVMPLWVNDSGISGQIGLNSASDLYNPIMSIYAGAYIYDYYRTMWKKNGYHGENLTKMVLLSYNRGRTTVLNHIKKRIDPENGYNETVTKKRDKLIKLDELVS